MRERRKWDRDKRSAQESTRALRTGGVAGRGEEEPTVKNETFTAR